MTSSNNIQKPQQKNQQKTKNDFNKSYIKIRVCDKVVYALADSGSAVTLIAGRILEENDLKELCNYTGNLVGAEGSALKVLGKLATKITIGEESINAEILVVENLQESVLIGRDVMVQNNCIISYQDLTFTVGTGDKTKVPLLQVQPEEQNVHKTFLTQTIEIPARTIAQNISCKLFKDRKSQMTRTFTGVFEPIEHVKGKCNVFSDNLMLNVKKGRSYVNITNSNDYPVMVYKNQRLGTIEACTRANINLVTEHKQRECESEPEQLTEAEKERLLYRKLGIDELTHLTDDQRQKVRNLVKKFIKCFAITENAIKPAKIKPQKIYLDTQVPIRAPFRPIPMALRPHAEREIQRLIDLDVIEYSNSPYHSPAFLVAKPNAKGANTKWRLISDFRLVNKHVIRSYQPLPDIESLTSMWNGCEFFSTLDLNQGYYQQLLDPESRPITACSIPGVASFQYKCTPLGLSSSSTAFQAEMERVLMGLKNIKCGQFLDDTATASETFQGMLENLTAIFERFLEFGLVLKPEKTKLFQKKVAFLGFILSNKGLEMDNKKCEGLTNMSIPRTKKQVKSFVSMAGFYRKFIRDFSLICRPLTEMLKNNVRFRWGEEQQEAFELLKTKISEKPILAFPDLNKTFTLRVDASDYGIGAILSQEGDQDGFQHPIAFASNLLTSSQQNWSAYQREFWAMKTYCEKFRILLLNKPFIIQTDHQPLLGWETSKHMEGPLWRWFHTLSQYDFKVEHVPGKKNNSDCPSRIPRTNDELFSNYEKNIAEKEALRKEASARRDAEKLKEEEDRETAKGINLVLCNMSEQEDNTEEHQDLRVRFADKKALAKAQKEDPNLQVVRSWVVKGEKPELPDKTRLNQELKTYKASFNRLKIIEDVLHRSWEKTSDEQPDWIVCLPEFYQETAIELAHDIPSSGHGGKFKTLERLRKSVYFPQCELRVSLYIDGCKECIIKSRKQKAKAPLRPFYGTYPNEIIQVDLCGPFPKNKKGYTMILVIICKFTGWAEAIPMKTTTSEDIARELLDTWVSRNGLPGQIHSDRGPQFTSKLIKAVYKLMGSVYQSHTCAYTPKSNGGAEAMVRIVKDLLKAYCADHGEIWPSMLQQVMLAYRSSVSTVTKYSPHFLKTGQRPKLCLDLLFDTFDPSKFETHGEFALDLHRKLVKTYKMVDSHLKTSRDFAKQRYDQKTNIKEFKVGDYVYLWRPKSYHKDRNTFKSNFFGPYRITKLISEYTYKIDVGSSRIHNIVPHDLLRLAPNGELDIPRHYQPSDELEWDHEWEEPIAEENVQTNANGEQVPERPVVVLDTVAVRGLRRGTRNRIQQPFFQAGFPA